MHFNFCFSFLSGIPIGITSSAEVLNIWATDQGIKKFESIIRKNKNKNQKIALSPNSKLNKIEVLISKSFIDSIISHDEFVSINNVLKE